MIVGLDSALPPTIAQVAFAKTAGVRLWSGYLQTRPNVRLYRPWTQAEFAVVKTLLGTPIAYASGWDDPAACKALAASWGVRLCLDVEDGIRGDGPWVQEWLDRSGAGLYGPHYRDAAGNWHSIHLTRRAAFHIASWYWTDDPHAAWPGSRPADGAPCGWQWQNTHTEFGVGVDRCWFDDWFAADATEQGGLHMDQDVNDALRKIGLTATAAALGAAMDDAALGGAWQVVKPDLSNLGSVAASYAKSHPGAARPAGPGGAFDAKIIPQ